MGESDLEPVPPCPVCLHEHAAVWARLELLATGPCHCGCMIETTVTSPPEYDETDTTVEEFDAMWDAGEPVEVLAARERIKNGGAKPHERRPRNEGSAQ